MAKKFNFHMYSHEIDEESIAVREFSEYNIQIKNQLGPKVADELEKEFVDESFVAVANEVSPPGDKGGGGEGPIFPLVNYLFVGLSIFVVTTKGFFDELGRELAKRLVKSLLDKQETTELTFTKGNKYFTIIVPKNTSLRHLKYLLKEIEKIKLEGKYIYIEKTKKLIPV